MCIGGEKLLPMADYLGNKLGYDADKMNFTADISEGKVLDVPILTESPVNFELEVARSIPLDDGEVFLCRIRNALYFEELADEKIPIGDRLRKIAPVSATCGTYFSYAGETLGAWGDPGKMFLKNRGNPAPNIPCRHPPILYTRNAPEAPVL